MLKSLAFWSTKEVKSELHFNLWKIKHNKQNIYKYFLDIGIKLKKESLPSSKLKLFINLPIIINEENKIEDLSKILIQDQDLLEAIFNKPIQYTGDGTGDIFNITNDKDTTFLSLLSLASKITIEQKDIDNTTISISFKEDIVTNINGDIYCRFRIRLDNINSFSQEIKDNDNLLKSAYKEEELVEFRINEVRNMPDKLKAHFRKHGNLLKIRQIHFFLVRDNQANLVLSHEEFIRCRSVEADLWQKYINDEEYTLNNNKKVLAYHWAKMQKKDEDDIEHYSSFAKFSYSKYDRLLLYIGIFILIGITLEVFGSLVYDELTDNTENKYLPIWQLAIYFISTLYVIIKIIQVFISNISKIISFCAKMIDNYIISPICSVFGKFKRGD